MKVKVILGTILRNDSIYKVGDELELSPNEVKAMKANGVVEEVGDKSKASVKKVKKVEKVEAKPKPEEKLEEVEPTEDWTRKELDDYARSHGLKSPEKFGSKKKLLEAFK